MKAFLFDYGATIDTRGEHWSKVIYRAYKNNNISVTWESFWQAYVNTERTLGECNTILPTDTFFITLEKKIALQLNYLSATIAEINSREESCDKIVRDIYAETLEVITESRDVLRQLAEKKHATMVLVSNFYGNIHTVLREFRLDGFFADIIESAEVGYRKPDIRIWQIALETLRKASSTTLHTSDITVVGDSMEKDILPAQALGCKTIHITHGLKRDIKI